MSRAMGGLASGLALTHQEVMSAIEKDPRWLDWQEGRISPRDWHLHLTKRLGALLTFEQFTEVWNRALDPNPIHSASFLSVSIPTASARASPTQLSIVKPYWPARSGLRKPFILTMSLPMPRRLNA